MKKKYLQVLGAIILASGIVFIINSFPGITGLAILENINKTASSVIGIVLVMGGILLLAKATATRTIKIPGVNTYTLDEIFKDDTSNKFRKSARFLGKSHLVNGFGDLPAGISAPDETHKELFNILELERLRGSSDLSVPNYQKIYNRHELSIPELGLPEAITYDAKTLSTGHRGAYRYVFDKKTGRYLGLAKHSRSHGGYRYTWA